MKKIDKRHKVFMVGLALVLVVSHINCLSLILGSDAYVAYSMEKTMSKKEMTFKVEFYEGQEALPLSLKGVKEDQRIHLELMSQMAQLMTMDYHLDTGEMTFEAGLWDLPDELMPQEAIGDYLKAMTTEDLGLKKWFSNLDIQVSQWHQVLDGQVYTAYTLNDKHVITIDYWGHLYAIKGQIDLFGEPLRAELTITS